MADGNSYKYRTTPNVTDTPRISETASPAELPGEAAQQRFWNEWNSKNRGAGYNPNVDPPTMMRRDTVLEWVRQLGLKQPRILDLGCATGWLSDQLAEYGDVVGTDLADASISEARQRYPHIRFECEDFSHTKLANGEFDIVVSLETLSHVVDQPAFINRIRDVLKPGGYLILTTQNRLVFERRSGVNPPASGQLRRWVSPRELRQLIRRDFVIRRFTTLLPEGQLGFLRLVNSTRLNRLLGRVFSQKVLERTKERLGFGQTIAVLAQRS
jgi:2-polyprenyl-3-methyl-5-hydroxy-6-metoxy-1,4-benzoquinol methylase